MSSYQPLSFVAPRAQGPWDTFLATAQAIEPYPGPLVNLVETPRRPCRALSVDIPIKMDNGLFAHFEGYRVHHNLSHVLSARGQRGL